MATKPQAEVVVAFLNTFDAETGHDDLDDELAWAAWAASHGLTPAGALTDALALRHSLRAAAADGEAVPDVTVTTRTGVVDRRPQTVAVDATGSIALAAVQLATTGEWARVKLCAAESCRWAFMDASRNRSRAWCSMEVCGNRAKARSFRARAQRVHSQSD